MTKKRRTWRAWAVVDDVGLVCWDYRLPVTWLKKLAIRDHKEKCFADDGSRVIPVLITEVKK